MTRTGPGDQAHPAVTVDLDCLVGHGLLQAISGCSGMANVLRTT
jgi:hypothetical protein